MTVKGNLSFLIDDSDNFAVGQCRLVVLIIDVAVAFCDWLSQCPVFISHYRQMTTTAYAQAVLAPGFNPQIAIVLLPDQTTRVMLHKWHGGASHILRVKIKKVIG